MKAFALLFCIISPVALAGDQEPTMTKLVFRFLATSASASSNFSSPKTIYIAGDRYARIEQEAAVGATDKNLIIVNQPDIWVIDSQKKQGNHMVNPGPTFTVHNPILGPDGPEELFQFEYGREVPFFERAASNDRGFTTINGIECKVHELRRGGYRIVMNVIRAKKIPHSIDIFFNDRLVIQLQYISYENDLPFDRSLFRPPEGISVTESSGTSE